MSLTTLYDEASLWMTPSSASDGKLYSQLPTDGSGDFTFSRGSNLAATRVDVNGLIEKGYENTLLGSNDWAQSDSQYEITGGEVGYDGTNDAWLVNKLAAAYFSKDALVLTGVHTISFYAKAGSLDRIFVFISGDAARFDLTNATAVTAGGNPVSQNIELVSGTTDWYRCSIVVNKTSTQNFLIKPQNSSNQDVTGTIYIQDAQLNQGLVAYPYLETTTAPVAGGVLENEPRLDYSGGASCPSLLLEPQRSNTLPNSEYLSGYDLARTNGTNNSATSPEGIDNAFKLYADTQTGAHYMRLNYTKTSDAVLSVFAKKGEETSFAIGNASFSQGVVFNLENGTITSESGGTGTIEDMGSDWYRCSYHRTAWADWQYIALRGNNTAYAGDGSSGIYLYGIQFEDGSYPTSYIPTYGTSQTRLGDLATDAGNASTFNDSEGVLYAEVKTSAPVTSAPNSLMLSINDGTNFNEVRFEFFTSNRLYASVRGADGEASTVQTITQTNYNKIAIKYTSSGCKFFVNGVGYAFDGKSISGLNAFSFSRANTTTSPFYGDVKQVLYFPTALSDADLATLTTI